MNKFINIFGIRIDPTTIKSYYDDGEDIIIYTDYMEDRLLIPHDGKSEQALKILDKVFLYE